MADQEKQPEVATKAPESDAANDSLIPGDSTAQSGTSMGEHCTTDRPAPTGEASSGEITKIAEVDCYVSKPSDYPHASARLLLLLSTGTGIHSHNNQLQADRFATEGFLVVMPDMFNKDPAPNSPGLQIGEPTSPSTIEQLKVGFAQAIHATSRGFQIDMWLARQTPEKVMPLLRKVIAGVQQEYADAVSYGGGIYAVGYCFGGKFVLLLSSDNASQRARAEIESDPPASGPLIKAGAVAHGTQVTEEDLQNINCPVTLVCVQEDPFFPDEIREEGKKHLDTKGLDYEMKVYPDVPHGFAVVGEYQEDHIKQAQKDAYAQILAWLQSH